MTSQTSQSLDILVLVSGRGTNLQAIIDAQTTNQIQSKIKAVISNKEGALALDRAKNAGIPSFVIPSKKPHKDDYNNDLLQKASELNPDLIVLAGYMKILPPKFVNSFKNRIINIHPSLLPEFPGLDAQEQAIKAGVKVTGCTVHYVDEGCDTGPIILQAKEEIKNDDDANSLSNRLLKKEHKTLIKAIQLIENNE